ncbi:MAG: TIGR03936 family radical SAM-associated protein, partial [Cyanobacteriota bacterium]|nr:TIGR03936 family radical SAM-associated protein [Cyanobacteriota bacterium]
AKTGSLALISHLDTLRMLERALRRTGLPVSFTGGFHPLPRLQLALSLPMGAEGLGEWMDLEFTEPVDPALVRQRLQAELTSEFVLLSAAEVPVFGPSLSQELASARWSFALALAPAQGGSAPAVDLLAWQQASDALLNETSLIWHDSDKKGRARQRECRPDLLHLGLRDPAQGPGAAPPGEVPVWFQLSAAIDPQGRSIRPQQVQHWLSERLARPLLLRALRRDALALRAC